MDLETTDPHPPRPASALPPGLPPGMFSDAQAEQKKANWVLGLGIASFFCSCFALIPALLVGVPLLKNAQNPEAKRRAKLGLLLGALAFALALLFSVLGFVAFSSIQAEDYVQQLDRERQEIERLIRE